MMCENHWREKYMKVESSSLTPRQSMFLMRTYTCESARGLRQGQVSVVNGSSKHVAAAIRD